ncbi:MAG: NlpC/P60 family protein, partial [Lachnospiraceae bacterium]|nr:NlpC/P60 family protein [Lachnospiraceae bacterium]
EDSYDSGSVLGERIVSLADQYVGYPYVYGGSSLTGGVDCSHFVWLILQKAGAYSGGYMTSSEFLYAGSTVSGLSSARAGDVIVYPHHVAIYDGYGGIVEAKGAAWGITHDRTADHTTILGIRRFT